jgi:hypothetical protein
VAGQVGDEERTERAREFALRATRLATGALPAQPSISVSLLAGYTQATAADLLRTLGLDRDDAHEEVGREAVAAGG